MERFKENLNDLYKIQFAADKREHAIREQNEDWKLFEATKFVYAFFAFNSLYSVDWETTINPLIEKDRELYSKESPESDMKLNDMPKIRRLKKFICNTLKETATDTDVISNQRSTLADRFKKELLTRVNKDANTLILTLNGITSDKTIDNSIKEQFIMAVTSILREGITHSRFTENLESILCFIYQVRNNVFHGAKNTVDMMEHEQRNRFIIYTSILLTVNELFFEAIEKRCDWKRNAIRKLNLNPRVFANENRARTGMPSQNAVRKFHSNPVNSKFNITVPKGPLFYPCSGTHILEPIKWLVEYIDEFHFADHFILPIPILSEKRVQHLRHENKKLDSDSYIEQETWVPLSLVSSIIEHEPYDLIVEEHRLQEVNRRRVKFADDPRKHRKVFKQDWELKRDSRKISVYRHLHDGLTTFASFDNVAVFVLCGDSLGDGGSGQKWFQRGLFDFILDKLLDNGLIVTDGSGKDYLTQDYVPWKSLWANDGANEKQKVDNPEDFTYYNRNFKCIGQCGHKYGPVYIWQVTKM